MASSRHRDRVLGSLLGVAIGDCLGAVTEGLSPSTIRKRHGTVSTYSCERPIWTSGTQQALTLVEATVRRGSPDPSWIGRRWIEMAAALEGFPDGIHRRAHPGFGASIEALRHGGDWRACGQGKCAGCANAVRILPIATALAHQEDDVLAAAVVDVSLITHRELRDISAALAAGWAAARLRREPGYPLPAARGRALLEELAEWLCGCEEHLASDHDTVRVESPSHIHDVSILLAGLARRFDEGWPAQFGWIERYASARHGRAVQATEECALCSIPAALTIVTGSSRRFEETLLTAVNFGHGAGTLSALTGGLVGAAAGERAIPARWRHIEGWPALVAWGEALARCTDPASEDSHTAAVGPGPERLPDVLELEQRLTLLLEEEQAAG